MTSELEQGQFRKGPMVTVMLMGAFFALLNETLLATALPTIMDDFDITKNMVQWLTTAFLLTNGVMVPISAFLIDRFTTRQLFLTAISIFVFGTLVASVANVFPVLLAGRVIQATGSGIMLPLLMVVVLKLFPPEKRGAAMGMAGIVISFAPAIGPTLSGWLLEHYSWRSLFYVVLPIAIGTLVFAYFAVENVTEKQDKKIDILSILLSSFGFGGMLFGFSKAGDNGFSDPLVLTCIIGGAIIIGLFVWRQLTLKYPMLEFKVFKNTTFTLSIVISMIVMMSLIGAETLLPLYMQTARDFSPLESGLMLLPGALVMGIMSPITGFLFDRVGAKVLAVPGLFIVGATTFMFTNLTVDTSFVYLSVVYGIRMFGLALILMPVMTVGLNQLPNEWHSHGSAMANTMQQVSGSIGTALLVTTLTYSAEHFTPDMSKYAGTAEEIKNQIGIAASIDGYNTAFFFASMLSLLGMVLALFLKRKSELN